MQRPTFSVRARFALVLLVVIPSFVFLAWRGTEGLASQRRLTDTLFNDIITTQHASATMVAAMDDVHTAALSALATRDSDRQRSRALTTRLSDELIPAVDADLATVQQHHAADEAEELETIADLTTRWQAVRALWNSMVLDPPEPTIAIARIDDAFGHLNQTARGLVARETRDGYAEYVDAAHPYRTQRDGILVFLSAALLAAVAAVVVLYRGILPRTRRYAAFAEKVADGAVAGNIESRGNDELAVLGRTLDAMARRRQRERSYDLSQVQFAETMQLTENEAEAHRMLRRHLERSIDRSEVVILNRNNSQDRLEAVTDIAPTSPLASSLHGAAPRACVAIRQARVHERAEGADALLQCSVCTGCPGASTCMPFLVGGEVIGSVLVTRPEPLEEEQTRRIRDSVVQAAPVLANLRNLAIAETRAATDSLTGLPNRRSIDANLMRMVAHNGRSMESIAVVLLDLDHFKNFNDRFGHAAGDEVLAAVGAAMRATIRESDFAGRYGGEEFIVVLPNTNLEGGVNVAELLRRAIGEVVIPSIDQAITVSIGVAVLPDHAADSTGLVRAADRALYLAKNNGRDRVETARANDVTADDAERRSSTQA
jgi:diguanylate cyclase (GGDEF)-like protein